MGRSRKRKTLLGRIDRMARRARTRGREASRPLPRLGRRKALWRFVGALALAPLAGTAVGQDYGYAPAGAVVSPNYPPAVYAPGMGGPGMGMAPAGYAGGPGYAVPAGGMGPLVAPPPMVPQGGGGIAIPSGSAFTTRFSTSSGIGDGLGWEDGFQSFGGWVPLGVNSESMVLYLDARGFTSFDEGGGGNFTLGYRYYMPGFDRFIGTYAAYDLDGGNSESHVFNRLAFGAESVGRYLTYRVNGYVPLEWDGEVVSTGQVGDPFFQGNNILFLDRTFTRYQYGGVDGEVGGPLPLVGKYGLSGFLGGYWVTSEVDDAVGFKGRIEANINDDLQIGGKLTTDEIFDTNVWVTLTLRSPRGSLSDWFRKDWLRQPSVQTQMDRSPEREYRITTDVKTTETQTLAINPADGLPYLVLHVDPNGGGGTGTFENPAAVINGPNGPQFDIVYVRPGTVLTNGPVVLFDDQRLLSTAVPHTFATQRGVFRLPGFTGGPLPLLRNVSSAPSSVIALADNNEVSGFRIDGTGGTSFVTGVQAFHAGIVGNGITSFDINRNVLTNVSSGVQVVHVGDGVGFAQSNVVSGRGLGASSGMSFAATDGNLLLFVDGNTVSGFLGEDVDDNDALGPGEDVNANNILDPGIGVNIAAVGAGTINASATQNQITGNDTGLRIAATDGGTAVVDTSLNAVTNNQGTGILVEGVSGTISAAVTSSTVSNNGGPGIEADASAGSDVALTIGSRRPFGGNDIVANAGAGVAITSRTGSVVRAAIVNNRIINTPDDGTALTRFTGEAINILATDDAAFLDSVIDANLIADNNTDAIRIEAESLATVRNVLIGNGDGDNNNGNLITGNLNGIHLLRSGDARVDEVRIIDNEAFNNFGSGLFVQAEGGLADVTDLVAAQNNFTGNGISGVRFEIAADAIINANLRDNRITANFGDGIFTNEDRFTIDQGAVSGTWSGNLISGNGGNGINSNARTDELFVGTIDSPNTISQNNLAGVLIQSSGDAVYAFNLIAQNGQGLNGNAATANSFGAGVDIQGAGAKTLLFNNNRILDNFGDGVEIASRDNGFFTFDINFTDNIVANNLGRGYDVLNTGDGDLIMTIRGTAPGRSVILNNAREGVYVVNTADIDQTQQGVTPIGGDPNVDPTHGMERGGDFDAQTYMTLVFTGNEVVGNGDATIDRLPGNGLVLRVGTTGGGYGFTSTGGFAGDGFAGVIATVNDNFFSGNAGADFYVESFTSTVDPPVTAGEWDADTFDVDDFEGDPLARLDLAFEGNVFDAIDVNNSGAFYNNDEPEFKSRERGADPDFNEDGPFEDGTRRRNAQRLADRGDLPPFGTPNPPGEPFEFEYPGMGESTFRITTQTAIDIGFVNGTVSNDVFFPQPFLLDDQPYVDFTDANGVIYSDDVDFGELPFGWSLIP